ncbi:LacI family DNA-binding transcriptional regulator [Paraburkholderia saeva]|uniref:HTH-type transcriptional regulator AscG n=1 Tax=Paraburkholderia saeva TaxID=2777537 RepID=A0A9N8WZU8_9BURK|nr:LacI family DNA-binding transcriptional regulator [Paraburkholderia saeva]CAG4886133.1 HTH-type transcriptional regulator AscG [Paraburkholderia saeva]CAG4887464.1 HTH-type transcriptional regulator AscG [Paraburkholderia saeva]CAG4901594.1 HTH-type transcriptional regulator AscG [Paraburkholderia saeva]
MATLKDVAALAGVGMSTASRAISGNGPVSAEAVARVQAAIEQLNFRPSSIGRAMATQSLGIIGLFVPTFFGSYYGTILKQTDTELRAVHRHVVVATGCGDSSPRERAIEAVQFLIGRDCDGVVAISHDLHDEDIAKLHSMHSRIVFLNRVSGQLPEASFCADHHRGGMLAARTLVEYGHREIAVISGPFSASDNQARIEGFFDELASHGIARSDVALVESDFSLEGGYAGVQTLLDSKRRFTGLFCANDTMAVSALARLQQAGISVPHDVSVIGYDDDYSAAYTAPGLTSVHIPTEELTQNAVRWLVNQCYGTSWEIFRDFPVTVTMRASVGAPRRA